MTLRRSTSFDWADGHRMKAKAGRRKRKHRIMVVRIACTTPPAARRGLLPMRHGAEESCKLRVCE